MIYGTRGEVELLLQHEAKLSAASGNKASPQVPCVLLIVACASGSGECCHICIIWMTSLTGGYVMCTAWDKDASMPIHSAAAFC